MTFQNLIDDVLHPSKEEAIEAWSRRVRANRNQVEHFREAPERGDFYAPTAAVFKTDPRRNDEEALNVLFDMVGPNETWLDIGAGGGRYALPLALHVQHLVAVEPSEAMLSTLRAGMRENAIANIQIIQGRWPTKDPPQVDVSLISHVAYDIEDIGLFLDAMEASTRRLCVAVMLDGAPSSAASSYWPLIHGEERIPLPALREFQILQIARGRLCETRLNPRRAQNYPAPEMLLAFLRQQLFIEPGGHKDLQLRKIIGERTTEPGLHSSAAHEPGTVGIISWKPR